METLIIIIACLTCLVILLGTGLMLAASDIIKNDEFVRSLEADIFELKLKLASKKSQEETCPSPPTLKKKKSVLH